jgi:squalene-hopene/tetraprenyl-beta-curcumene cyclase
MTEMNNLELMAQVERLIGDSVRALKSRQKADGHWVFDLEADATIPAEYIFLNHFLDEREPEVEARLADYIRKIQEPHGGWALFHRGAIDISASVKAYWALKTVGDDVDAPHMRRAREAILAAGGAERSNVFTRYAMALFGHVPWLAVPVMPVEIMLLPRWFPINLWRMSYWSRTVIAPLLVLASKKPRAINPTGTQIRELFVRDPATIRNWQTNPTGKWTGDAFIHLDKVLRKVEPRVPHRLRERARRKAFDFFVPRLNGEDGLGAIFPAMANAVMAMEVCGYAKDHPLLVTAKKSIKLLVTQGAGPEGNGEFVQPCVSPVWDTSLTLHAMIEAGERPEDAANWLQGKQILDVKGDWAVKAPDLAPGGWAFQYNNDHYPDVDDTAVVGMALHRLNDPRYDDNIRRAEEWIIGMQSSDGGWGAFDIDNNDSYLNHIPFADHGALLDPPTADVSARCISFLAQLGHRKDHAAVARGIAYLKKEQEADGSWFGRWGTNYVYGTWSVLCALNAAGEDMQADYIRRAVNWLYAMQNTDGGWGEGGETYYDETRRSRAPSAPSTTAWATLGLMAAGEVEDARVRRGIAFITSAPREPDGRWQEPWFTAVGFPRVFYLRYHGYAAFFPTWALARYRNLVRGNTKEVAWGM